MKTVLYASAILLGLSLAVAAGTFPGHEGLYPNAEPVAQGSSPSFSQVTVGTTPDCAVLDETGMLGCTRTTDAAPTAFTVRPQNAYPGAAVNLTGADYNVSAGAPTLTIVIDDFSKCALDDVTVVINGSGNMLTEGGTWTAAVSNASTCTSLASAVNALSGVDATCSTATVRITLDDTEAVNNRTTLSSASDCLTESTNSAGTIVSWHDSRPGLNGLLSGIDADGDSGWSCSADDVCAFKLGGTTKITTVGGELRAANLIVSTETISNNTASGATACDQPTNVTGFAIPATSGKYYVWDLRAEMTSASSTTGRAFTWTGPAGVFHQTCIYPLTATTQITVSINVLGAMSCASGELSSGSVTHCYGYFAPTGDGTYQLQLGTEVSGSAVTMGIGSRLSWEN